MARTLALVLLAFCSVEVLVCLIDGRPATSVVFGAASLAFPPALIALGASREGCLGPLRWPLLLLALLLEGCFAAMLLLSGHPDPEGWWLGFPPATAVMLYGLWLAPLVLISLVYAWHFERYGLRDEDLRRIRELARRRREGGAGEP